MVTREMRHRHADAEGITTTGLFAATAAAAAAGAALKTAVDRYTMPRGDTALEGAFDALVHAYVTGTAEARKTCLNKMQRFTVFARDELLTHDGKSGVDGWKSFYASTDVSTQSTGRHWGEQISAREGAEFDRRRTESAARAKNARGGPESDDIESGSDSDGADVADPAAIPAAAAVAGDGDGDGDGESLANGRG